LARVNRLRAGQPSPEAPSTSLAGASIAVIACLVACGPAGEADGPPTSPVVARWGDVQVTVADLDARVLALPATQRPKPGADLDAWFEGQIRELIVQRELAREARETGLDQDPAFLAAQRDTERQLTVQLCLADLIRVTPVTNEAVRIAYEERSASLGLPERRRTYHIFLRAAAGLAPSALESQIGSLRDRILRGESFPVLARNASHSESRHQEGYIGSLVRGQLPEGFDRIVFGLEEGVPSEPVLTRDGAHLFYVDQILPARHLSFEEARRRLAERLATERRQAAIAALEAEIPWPPDALFLDREQLAEVTRAGDGAALVLKLGDTQLTLADLQRRVAQARSAGHAVQHPWTLLEQLRRRELLYGHCQTGGRVPPEELEEAVRDWRTAALPAAQRQRRLVELAESDASALELFFASNEGAFSTPPRWQLRRLRVPIRENATAVMARLEEAARRADARLDALGAELGGAVEDMGTLSLLEIQRLAPKLATLVAPLQVGQCSPPYRAGSNLEIAEVLARTDSEAPALDEVRKQVAAAYVAQYTAEVYRDLSERILAAHELDIRPEGLAMAREAGLASPEVSVEEIEALLDEL